jgi:hypothetical protein
MRRAEYGTIPVGHHQVVSISQAIRTGFGAQALLATFKLLEESEVAWNLGRHDRNVLGMEGFLRERESEMSRKERK